MSGNLGIFAIGPNFLDPEPLGGSISRLQFLNHPCFGFPFSPIFFPPLFLSFCSVFPSAPWGVVLFPVIGCAVPMCGADGTARVVLLFQNPSFFRFFFFSTFFFSLPFFLLMYCHFLPQGLVRHFFYVPSACSEGLALVRRFESFLLLFGPFLSFHGFFFVACLILQDGLKATTPDNRSVFLILLFPPPGSNPLLLMLRGLRTALA